MSVRRCVTKEWKRSQAARPGGCTLSAGAPGGVFAGTLYVVAMTVDAPKGPYSVNGADLAVALDYLGRASPAIQAYASQFGSARLGVGTNPLPFRVSLSRPQYSDADLQGWVNQLAGGPGMPADAAVIILNPIGLTNTDAKESGGVGVLGYHGLAKIPYSFVNLLGAGFTIDDARDVFAEALSHEVAEMTVDPAADNSRPEVCDGCGTNCQGQAAFRIYFDRSGAYLGGTNAFPPPYPYDHFISAIATPDVAALCPAPSSGCVYAPPSAP